MTETCLTNTRGLAAQRYRSAHEKSLRQGHGERRVMAMQAYQAARAALTAQQVAILDMAVLRGQDLVVVALKAGRTLVAMEALLTQACDALQAHYRSVDEEERRRQEAERQAEQDRRDRVKAA